MKLEILINRKSEFLINNKKKKFKVLYRRNSKWDLENAMNFNVNNYAQVNFVFICTKTIETWRNNLCLRYTFLCHEEIFLNLLPLFGRLTELYSKFN